MDILQDFHNYRAVVMERSAAVAQDVATYPVFRDDQRIEVFDLNDTPTELPEGPHIIPALENEERCCLAQMGGEGVWIRCSRPASDRSLTFDLQKMACLKCIPIAIDEEAPHREVCTFHWRVIKYARKGQQLKIKDLTSFENPESSLEMYETDEGDSDPSISSGSEEEESDSDNSMDEGNELLTDADELLYPKEEENEDDVETDELDTDMEEYEDDESGDEGNSSISSIDAEELSLSSLDADVEMECASSSSNSSSDYETESRVFQEHRKEEEIEELEENEHDTLEGYDYEEGEEGREVEEMESDDEVDEAAEEAETGDDVLDAEVEEQPGMELARGSEEKELESEEVEGEGRVEEEVYEEEETMTYEQEEEESDSERSDVVEVEVDDRQSPTVFDWTVGISPQSSSDSSDDGEAEEETKELVDEIQTGLSSLSAARLRQYLLHFGVPTKGSASKTAMLEAVDSHFRSLPADSRHSIAAFLSTHLEGQEEEEGEGGQGEDGQAKTEPEDAVEDDNGDTPTDAAIMTSPML